MTDLQRIMQEYLEMCDREVSDLERQLQAARQARMRAAFNLRRGNPAPLQSTLSGS